MDYKKIIRSPAARQRILGLLRFVPDVPMLKLQYRIKTGRSLELKKPRRFTEKLQWYKLYYHNPLLHLCADKCAVRTYVERKGLGELLVRLYARYDNVDQVDWRDLPQRFVIKTTNGGGGLNVIVYPDKAALNLDEAQEKLRCEKSKPRDGGREWAYYGLEPGIIVEELLENKEDPEAGIHDYKFFCYDGKPQFIVVDTDRYTGHKRNFYDTEWNDLHIVSDCPPCSRELPRPDTLAEMLHAAAVLSEDFPFVRVDLYSVNGKVYFGELTFYPWSGYVQFQPDEADYLLGKDFPLKSFEG